MVPVAPVEAVEPVGAIVEIVDSGDEAQQAEDDDGFGDLPDFALASGLVVPDSCDDRARDVAQTSKRGRGRGRGRGIGRGRGRGGEGFGHLFGDGSDDGCGNSSRWVREEILAGVGNGGDEAAREAEEAVQAILEEENVDLAEAPLLLINNIDMKNLKT